MICLAWMQTWKARKKSRGQLVTHPLMFQCHEQRRTCSCTTAFLVLAERRIPISRTESIWIYLPKHYDKEYVFKNWVQIKDERNTNVIYFPNSSQRWIAYRYCLFLQHRTKKCNLQCNCTTWVNLHMSWLNFFLTSVWDIRTSYKRISHDFKTLF